MLAKQSATVKVPATSANLGAGFDVLGLALSFFDELSVEVTTEKDSVEISGEGELDLPLDGRHLVIKSLRKGLELVGESAAGLSLKATNRIPHSRGMGSSSAAIVAGVLLAQALVGEDRISTADLINLAGRLEGHPDNIAPCILGGMTIAWMDDDGHHAVQLDVHPDVVPIVAIPNFKVPTVKARNLLPLRIPHDDAVFNISRSSLMVYAMTKDPSLLLTATEDRLHQRQRADVMPETLRVIGALRREGIAAMVSGAGPTVLSLTTTAQAGVVKEIVAANCDGFEIMQLAVDQGGAKAS
jgi:homoserine kinase